MPKMLVVFSEGTLTRDIDYLLSGWMFQTCNSVQDEIQGFQLTDCILFVGVNPVSFLRQTTGRRVVSIPSLDNVRWTKQRMAFVRRIINEGETDVEIHLDKRTGQVIAEDLVPF